MRILKIICIFFCVQSVASAIYGAYHIHSAPFGTVTHIYSTPLGPVTHVHSDAPAMLHGVFGPIFSLALAGFWASAFYGIHKKAPLTWKLGWGVIAVGFLEFLIGGLSSAMKIPEADPRWIMCAAVVVAGTAVTLYWSFWWNRQKSYFAPRASSTALRP